MGSEWPGAEDFAAALRLGARQPPCEEVLAEGRGIRDYEPQPGARDRVQWEMALDREDRAQQPAPGVVRLPGGEIRELAFRDDRSHHSAKWPGLDWSDAKVTEAIT